MVGKEILAILKANKKGTKSPKLEKPHPPILVSMYFTSTFACMNFLSRFYFLTPVDYSPWFERAIWPNLKRSKISENREATLTKFGFHAFHINLYLHAFFEPILFFEYHECLWSKENFGCFERKRKRGKISETGESTPTKFGFHAFHVNLYFHAFFEPIQFCDPKVYVVMVQRENLKESRME